MQIDDLAKQLQILGLSEKQAKVYMASTFLGPAPAQKIAEQAHVNRPTTYNIIEELTALGLMSRTVERRKTLFMSGGINALEQLVKNQADAVKQRQQELDKLLPLLEQMERPHADAPPVVRFVRGKEGLDAVWRYMIRTARPGSEILSMTNNNEIVKVYPRQSSANPSLRLSKRLSSKVFYYSDHIDLPTDKHLLRESVRLRTPVPADITLYEDKAVLLSYGSEASQEWTGVVIESKEIIAVLRQLYMLAWRKRGKNV